MNILFERRKKRIPRACSWVSDAPGYSRMPKNGENRLSWHSVNETQYRLAWIIKKNETRSKNYCQRIYQEDMAKETARNFRSVTLEAKSSGGRIR
jgi:hypothetical protein